MGAGAHQAVVGHGLATRGHAEGGIQWVFVSKKTSQNKPAPMVILLIWERAGFSRGVTASQLFPTRLGVGLCVAGLAEPRVLCSPATRLPSPCWGQRQAAGVVQIPTNPLMLKDLVQKWTDAIK